MEAARLSVALLPCGHFFSGRALRALPPDFTPSGNGYNNCLGAGFPAGFLAPSNNRQVIMITQKEFVENCQSWYKEADIQPGNPEDGVWQECHYPTPKCLGGRETILLLEQHHAVQGVLQSLEYNHCCIRSWEKNFLTGCWEFLLPYYYSIKKKAMLEARGTKQEASSRSKENMEKMKEEGKLFWDPEWQKEQGRKGFLAQPREVRVEAGRKTTSMRVRCLITGHISTPGGIGQWQKKRGIDPSNREFLN